MNLQKMRAAFKRRAAGLANGLADSDIDEYLNHAYQHSIPDRIAGQLSDGIWTLTLVAGTAAYDFPDYVYAVRSGIRIGTSFLNEFDRTGRFDELYDPEDATLAQPIAVLNYGRQLKFWKAPDDEYDVTIPARLYPTSTTGGVTSLASLTASGITWFTHATAVIWAAEDEFASDYSLDDLQARARAQIEPALSAMAGRESTRVRRRRPRRTF